MLTAQIKVREGYTAGCDVELERETLVSFTGPKPVVYFHRLQVQYSEVGRTLRSPVQRHGTVWTHEKQDTLISMQSKSTFYFYIFIPFIVICQVGYQE